MEKNKHAGHRDRLRNEFLANVNNTSLSEHRLLEMLLFYGIPQKDTNPIAHELIERFGSFSGVFEADTDELASVKGMTRNAAALIKLVLPLARQYVSRKYDTDECFTDMESIGNFLLSRYFAVPNERLCLLCLDNFGKKLSFDIIKEGTLDSVEACIRPIVERAILVKAKTVIISHNHPGSIAVPSREDVAVTVAVRDALRTVSIKLSDHIIISGDDYISMSETFEYKELFA